MITQQNPDSHFLTEISAPARRALEKEGLITLQMLAACSESELLQLHGVGPDAIKKIRLAMKDAGVKLKDR